VLGGSAAPRLEFRIDLRQRLIEEARQIALQPKTGPPRRRACRPKGGGGIRLAAIGIGFSLAGGGVVAAAHSLSLPAKPGPTIARASPGAPVTVRHAPPAGPAATTVPPFTAPQTEHVVAALAPPASPASPKATSKAPLAGAVASPLPSVAVSTPTLPSLLASAGASPGRHGAPEQPAPSWHRAVFPSLVPSWLGPSPRTSAGPFHEVSPLR
jgi:hypothetical protein